MELSPFLPGTYQGRVMVRDREVARHKVAEMSRHVGLVLQDFEPQLFSTNVELEMAFGPENLRLPGRRSLDELSATFLSWAWRTSAGGSRRRFRAGRSSAWPSALS